MRARRLVFCWLLLFVGLAPAWAETRHLTILHINDLHARFMPDGHQRGGIAYLATIIRREREGCAGCILLNAGDLVQGSPVSTIYRGVPVYQVANMLGIDVSTIGNHEFDYTWRGVQKFLRMARFEMVSANLVDAQERLMTRRPYTIRNVNGIRVAIIGAMTNELPTLTTPNLLGEWHALPVLETVQRYAAEVAGKSDLIVVLGHIDLQEENEILAKASQVAVVVSGHLHTGLEEAVRMDGRILVRVKSYGEELGRLDLDVDTQTKAVGKSAWKRIEVDASTIKPAPDVAKVVAEWEAKVSKVVDVPIGASEREFASKDLKALIERAMAEETGADFAYMNLGGVRDFLPKGTILARNVWNILPFDNRIVTGRFKGSQLPASVTSGRTVDPDREYTLAVSDFVAANQKTEMSAEGLTFPETGVVQRDAVIDWIKKKKVIQ